MSVSVFWLYFSCLQIASFLCCNRSSSVVCLAVTCFSTLSYKGQYFREKKYLRIKWVFCCPYSFFLSYFSF